jgi:hypothetical protein
MQQQHGRARSRYDVADGDTVWAGVFANLKALKQGISAQG